jgi:predicted oxidoreductase
MMKGMSTHLLSPIAAGTWRLADWQFSPAQTLDWIEACVDLGITSFDHADIYGGYTVEALFGQALARKPGLRQRLQLVTKCGIRLKHPNRPEHALKSYDTSAAHVRASVEASLQALGTDHLDLLLIHRPDALTDPDELAQTFAELRQAGKVLHFGVSNHAPQQFMALHRRLPLVTNQIEFSPLQMKALADGTLEQATELARRPMIWSPLGGGRLFTGDDAQAQRVRLALQGLANEHGASLASVAYAWILRHPSRPIPITGSGRMEALKEAVDGLRIRLTAEQWWSVWQASMGHEVP